MQSNDKETKSCHVNDFELNVCVCLNLFGAPAYQLSPPLSRCTVSKITDKSFLMRVVDSLCYHGENMVSFLNGKLFK